MKLYQDSLPGNSPVNARGTDSNCFSDLMTINYCNVALTSNNNHIFFNFNDNFDDGLQIIASPIDLFLFAIDHFRTSYFSFTTASVT